MPNINRRLGGGLAAAVKARGGLAAAVAMKITKKQNLVVDDDSYYDDEEDEDKLEDSKGSTRIETGSERPSTSTSARGVNHYDILRETLDTPSRAERSAKATKIEKEVLQVGDESEGSYYDEEDDDKGLEINDEITEEDINAAKLKALHEKLEEEYNDGFVADKDPNKLIEMKTLQMTFLDIGPTV
jgi:hypothetical protein